MDRREKTAEEYQRMGEKKESKEQKVKKEEEA